MARQAINFAAAAAAIGIAYLLIRPGSTRADTSISEQDTNLGAREADQNPLQTPQGILLDMPSQDPLSAFLYMIRASEHVFPRDVIDGDAYNIFYGGRKFRNLSDHPVITGEMQPVKLSDSICINAGLKPGCVSTAAGAYQIIRPTWIRLKERLNLPDFSPASQDAAAIELLRESGALDAILDNDIETAIRKASKIWASLPGNTYKQAPKSLAYALDRYNEGLGIG